MKNPSPPASQNDHGFAPRQSVLARIAPQDTPLVAARRAEFRRAARAYAYAARRAAAPPPGTGSLHNPTPAEIAALLAGHALWLAGASGGRRAADLCSVNLSGADLRGSDLRRADLRGIKLSGTALARSDLSGADLSGADMRNSNLRGVNLSNAVMRNTDLRGADLRGACLARVTLTGARLGDANMLGAGLTLATKRRLYLRGAITQ